MTTSKIDGLRILNGLLQDRHMYDIITALRGPDENSMGDSGWDIKKITTAVLRAQVGMESKEHGSEVSTIQQAREEMRRIGATPGRKDTARKYWLDCSHFKVHIRRAFGSLYKYYTSQGKIYKAADIESYVNDLAEFLNDPVLIDLLHIE